MAEYKQGGNQLRPLTEQEKKYAEENYHLIGRFMKIKKLNPEIYFDVLVFEYLLAVEKYCDNTELQNKSNFEAVSFKYMERALLNHYRSIKAKKRSSAAGTDVSYEEVELDNYLYSGGTDILDGLEYEELLKEIGNGLSEEQNSIFSDRLEGYSLRNIAARHKVKEKHIYYQFSRIKRIVADIMGI